MRICDYYTMSGRGKQDEAARYVFDPIMGMGWRGNWRIYDRLLCKYKRIGVFVLNNM
jgi:hypothetical protein